VKFSDRFDCLANRTFCCYNLLSHIRFLVTDKIRATFGLQPACGLFYDMRLAGVCQ
jgi:hypothetical protein